jgi:hypothetical protein
MIFAFFVLSLFCIVPAFVTANAKDKGLNRGIKTVHAIILFCLALVCSEHLHTLFRVIMHPQWIINTSYVPVGFIPPWLVLVQAFLSLIIGLLELGAAGGLARRDPRIRLAFTRCVWVFWLFNCVTVLRVGVHRYSKKGLPERFWVPGLILCLIITVFYFILWWFYSRKKTKRLLFGLETSGSDSEQPAPVDVESQDDGEVLSESSSSRDD